MLTQSFRDAKWPENMYCSRTETCKHESNRDNAIDKHFDNHCSVGGYGFRGF